MSNIPKLRQNVQVQGQTRIADNSGIIREQQTGAQQFSQQLGELFQAGGKILDNKIYESEVAANQDKTLEFMSYTKDEKAKADYLKKNNGSLVGFAQDKGQSNLDRMNHILSQVNHPRARKELERKLAFQAEKSLINDLDKENRSIKLATNLAEQGKNEVLGREIQTLGTSPTDSLQYDHLVSARLNEINRGVVDGRLDLDSSLKMRDSLINNMAFLRTKSLIDQKDFLQATTMFEGKSQHFTNEAMRERARAYALSKQDDISKTSYMNEKLELDRSKLRANKIMFEASVEASEIPNLPITDTEKQAKIADIRSRVSGKVPLKFVKQIDTLSAGFITAHVNKRTESLQGLSPSSYDSRKFDTVRNELQELQLSPNLSVKDRRVIGKQIENINKVELTLSKAYEKEYIKKQFAGPENKHKVKAFNKYMVSDEIGSLDIPVDGKIELGMLYLKTGKGLDRQSYSPTSDMKSGFRVNLKSANEEYKKDTRKFRKDYYKKIRANMDDWYFLDSSGKKAAIEELKLLERDLKNFDNDLNNFENEKNNIIQRYKGKE